MRFLRSNPRGVIAASHRACRTIISGANPEVVRKLESALDAIWKILGVSPEEASGYQLLPDSLRRCVGAIASSQFGLRLLEVAADRFFTDAKALGDFVASHPQRYQPQDRELARRYTRLVWKAVWAVADHLFEPRRHEPRGGD